MGHSDSTWPALTPTTTKRWMSLVPRGSVTCVEVVANGSTLIRVNGRRSGLVPNSDRRWASRAVRVSDGRGAGWLRMARNVDSVVV